jgi:hypothetical protein
MMTSREPATAEGAEADFELHWGMLKHPQGQGVSIDSLAATALPEQPSP